MTNDARPAVISPVNRELCKDATTTVGAGISHADWLATLKRQDMVLVRNGSMVWKLTMITDATPRYLFLGKLKFHRSTGWQVGRQAKKVYRMQLRLVRSAEEFQ